MMAVIVDRLDDKGCGVHVETMHGRAEWTATCFAQRLDSPAPYAQMPTWLLASTEEAIRAAAAEWLTRGETFAFGPREPAIALWWAAKEVYIDEWRSRLVGASNAEAARIEAVIAGWVAERERQAAAWRAMPSADAPATEQLPLF